MRYITIDLEIEQPNTRFDTTDSAIDHEKIIQVGIAILELGKGIIHSETINIHYDKPISAFIKKLTGITEEDLVDSTMTSELALKKIAYLREVFGTDRKIVEWGSGDMALLVKETGLNPYSDLGLARSTINAKVLFQCYAVANGIKEKGGLSKSMGKLNLGFKNTHYKGRNRGAHWAETDAVNTALIFEELMKRMKHD